MQWLLLIKEEGENNMAGMSKTINSCSATNSKGIRDIINSKDINKEQIVSIVYAIDRFYCFYYEQINMEKFNNEHKEEYNKEPVYYCKKCLSLKIGYVAVLEGSEYCEDCNSTNIEKATIEEWDKMFFNRYGYHYLEEFKDK